MKNKKFIKIIIWFLVVIFLCVGAYVVYDRGRPAPVPVKHALFEGVTYRRIVHLFPRPMIAHVIVIDRKDKKNAQFFVTPADTRDDLPLNARTTSQFLDEFGLQIAINGDGFSPWWSRGPADYYPQVGEPVAPLGFTASNGDIYTEGVEDSLGVGPTIYFSRKHYPSFNRRPGKVFTAISGDRMIVEKGEYASDLDSDERDPRTAIGINKNGRYLYLVVVDGRQPLYSDGATFTELAQLLIDQGAYFAMALDGGGSSTLVIEGENGEPVLLNSPIDNYIPGRERPVANHLGVFINP
ncbi:MAG TPA: phosphodiester glycosidase family protein [Anaerolineales bacterium]|nr:phosphodiester glycosidase family protein [Anaerolineales bacterium]